MLRNVQKQDYEAIRKACLAKGTLWEDPSFPADNRSLFPNKSKYIQAVWKRPGELVSNPRMYVGGISRFDVDQGQLGNCWFLAATASLVSTGNKDRFHKVVPKENLFGVDYGYAGVFHFKLWQYGKWVDIVIDDRLPTVNDGQLAFVHSKTNNEFWSPLLEKAYAKLYGSYEALVGGSTAEAMEDFTGGMTMTLDLSKKETLPKQLFLLMKKALDREALMGCSIDSRLYGGVTESKLPNGLVVGHAYSVTAAKTVAVGGRQYQLLRVRNPWGDKNEWKGAWSDDSPEWKNLSQADKDGIELTFADDGEFWMTFDDFTKNFSQLEACLVMSMDDNIKTRWEMAVHDGSWKRGVNAGGCTSHPDTYWTNPQYRIQVVDPDEDDEDNEGTLFVSLIQKDSRQKLKELGIPALSIGYKIYKIPDGQVGPLDKNFLAYNNPVESSGAFTNCRDRVTRHKLKPGTYAIIPCTYEQNREGDFLLRLATERPAPSSDLQRK